MRRIRARIQHTHHIYIHNDLASAAYFVREKVEANAKVEGGVEGSYFEMLACVTMTAFALEAKINFLGEHLLGRKWQERDSSYKKLKNVCRALGLTANTSVKPYTAFEYLKEIRDTLTHGKPELIAVDTEVVGTPEEVVEHHDKLQAHWEYHVKPELVLEAYENAMELWKLLLEVSGLALFDTLTHGAGGISYIEDVLVEQT